MAALAGGVALSAQAPDQDALAAELLRVMRNPIASASKHEQNAIESPQAFEVITAEEIRASGAFRLADVLRLATSVQVWDMAGERATLTMRGYSPSGIGSTVQILLDGVPLYNIVAMPIDINGLPVPIDAIDRVEIVRGPSSALYGANAQMGVVAITTRKAGQGVEGSLRAGTAKDGIQNQQGFVSFGSERFSLVAGIAGNSRRNLDRPLAILGRAGASLAASDASHGHQVYVRPEWTPWKGGRIWGSYGHGEDGHGDALGVSPVDLSPLVTSANRYTMRQIAQVGWAQAWSETFKTELQIDQKTYKLREGALEAVPGSDLSIKVVQALAAAAPGIGEVHDFFYDRVRRASLQINWDPGSGFHLVGGLDTSRIKVSNVLVASQDKDTDFSATGGFLSLDWRTGALSFSAGARLANETLGGTSASPRASVVWTLEDGAAIRLGYFTSVRSPMATEKVFSTPTDPLIPYNLVQNPGLRSEKAQDCELGYRKAWSRISMDVTFFVTELKKVVVLAPYGTQAGGVTGLAFVNTPDTFSDSGVEVSVTADLGQGLLLGGNASTARLKDPIYGLDQQADYSPKAQGSLWAGYRHGILFAYVAVQRMGAYTIVVPGGQDRTTIGSTTQAHFNLGVTPAKGVSVSVYGVNASRGAQASSNMGLLDQDALRYSRRELGIQAGFRF